MQFRRSGQRDERRRRVLNETLLDSVVAAGVRTAWGSVPPEGVLRPIRRSENYGDAAFMDEQLRLTDLIPRRAVTLFVLFLVGLAMAAGLTTLRLISRPGFHAELTDYTTRLLDGLQQRADAAGIPFVTTQAGGMFGLYFSGADDIVTFDDVMGSDADLFKRFFHLMLEGGVYLAPSAFEAGFTSIAHGEAELKLTLDAAERAFAALKQALK